MHHPKDLMNVAGTFGGQNLGCEAAPKVAPVLQSLDELAAMQRTVGDRLEQLFNRLDPLLIPVPPANACGPVDRPISCPIDAVLLARINDEHRTLRALDQLLERLAV